MVPQMLIRIMERTPGTLRELLAGVSEEEARWRPSSGAWSIVEIVNHLADEEHEDFRARLALTLEDPSAPWPPIDPEAAAVSRAYNERRLSESIERFCDQRRASLAWLRSLSNPDWSLAHEHPALGRLRAGDLLTAWAAHDQLHLRQIAKRLFELIQKNAPDFSTRYAGAWGP